MHGLCFYDAGARSFYTKDVAVNSPDDLKDMKIRVMRSQTSINLVKSMGALPTPMSWGELYTSLQSGVVDGAENNPPSFYTSHHYEVCKHYTLNEHSMIPDVLVVSTVVWNKLSEQEKQWLQQAAQMSVPVQRQLWHESELESLKIVQEHGVEIIYPDKEPFAKRVEGIIESYKSNPEIYDLIQQIRQTE
jgi:TRAP-type C4-dicarboxylate transport system substrate-binding protein